LTLVFVLEGGTLVVSWLLFAASTVVMPKDNAMPITSAVVKRRDLEIIAKILSVGRICDLLGIDACRIAARLSAQG
jgi:hypothetical protein